MQPFTKSHRYRVPLDRANVDTDQIIPKQFLKRIERTGFGEFLFYDWRYLPERNSKPGVHHESSALSKRFYFGYRQKLWLRFFTRTRTLGTRGVRNSRDHCAFIRRHLRQQLLQEWNAAHRSTGDHRGEIMQRTQENEGYKLTFDLQTRQSRMRLDYRHAFKFPSFSVIACWKDLTISG
jgi:3-isopropylmalate dehydratase small subunit